MTAAVASLFLPEMTKLVGASGGAVQDLNSVTKVGGRRRVFASTLTLASQAAGTTFGVARLPIGAIITDMTLITDTSLGSTTIALGDYSDTALYKALATFTATDTPTRVGKASAHGQPITGGYDCVTGAASRSYQDITLTTAAATLPSSGSLTIIIGYSMD